MVKLLQDQKSDGVAEAFVADVSQRDVWRRHNFRDSYSKHDDEQTVLVIPQPLEARYGAVAIGAISKNAEPAVTFETLSNCVTHHGRFLSPRNPTQALRNPRCLGTPHVSFRLVLFLTRYACT